MGPVTAFKMVKEHNDIEGVLEFIKSHNENQEKTDPEKKKKYTLPQKFLYEESRDLFINPDVTDDKEALEKLIVFDKPDEAALKDFLITEK